MSKFNFFFSLKATALAAIFATVAIFPAHAHPIDKAELNKLFEIYLMENPDIVEAALVKNQKNKQDQKAQKITDYISTNKAKIESPEGMYIGGNPDGDITLVEFFDYNCGYCKQSFEGINLLLQTDKNLKVVMYELPILAQSSLTAARASLAAKKQGKYWEFHSATIQHQGSLRDDAVFAYAKQVGLDVALLRKDMVSEEVEKALIDAAQLAEDLEVNGTPAFIIDGELYPGAIGFENMLAAIADSRAKNAAASTTN